MWFRMQQFIKMKWLVLIDPIFDSDIPHNRVTQATRKSTRRGFNLALFKIRPIFNLFLGFGQGQIKVTYVWVLIQLCLGQEAGLGFGYEYGF